MWKVIELFFSWINHPRIREVSYQGRQRLYHLPPSFPSVTWSKKKTTRQRSDGWRHIFIQCYRPSSSCSGDTIINVFITSYPLQSFTSRLVTYQRNKHTCCCYCWLVCHWWCSMDGWMAWLTIYIEYAREQGSVFCRHHKNSHSN